MQFQTIDELKRIAELLAESDFERGEIRWSPEGGSFVLETARPPADPLQAGGLFRRSRTGWIPCRLTVQNVRGISIQEEVDVRPPEGGLLQIEPAGEGARIHLRSSHALRITLDVSRVSGDLQDAG